MYLLKRPASACVRCRFLIEVFEKCWTPWRDEMDMCLHGTHFKAKCKQGQRPSVKSYNFCCNYKICPVIINAHTPHLYYSNTLSNVCFYKTYLLCFPHRISEVMQHSTFSIVLVLKHRNTLQGVLQHPEGDYATKLCIRNLKLSGQKDLTSGDETKCFSVRILTACI